MTAPEAGWHHDGRFNLLDLVEITEIDGRVKVGLVGEDAGDMRVPHEALVLNVAENLADLRWGGDDVVREDVFVDRFSR